MTWQKLNSGLTDPTYSCSYQLHETIEKDNYRNKAIKAIVNALLSELKLFHEKFSIADPWKIFSERTLLGFVCTGLSRNHNDKILTVQEFGCWSKADENKNIKSKLTGRMDVLFHYEDKYILTEAKFGSCFPNENYFDKKIYNDRIDKTSVQLDKYLQYDIFDNKGKYNLILMFQEIKKNDLKKYDKHKKLREKFKTEIENTFYFTIENTGLETDKRKSQTFEFLNTHTSILEIYGKFWQTG